MRDADYTLKKLQQFPIGSKVEYESDSGLTIFGTVADYARNPAGRLNGLINVVTSSGNMRYYMYWDKRLKVSDGP